MSTTVTAQFWIRPADGASANGGGYDAGISGAGTNYCDQASPQASWTSELSLSSGTLTDTSGLFTAAMIGNLVNVASQGMFWITARADAHNVTVVAATNTSATSFSGASGKVGGAFATPRDMTVAFNSKAPAVAGNQINVRGAGLNDPTTPDINITYTDLSSGPTGAIGTPIRWVGYNGRPFYKTTGDCAIYDATSHVFENFKFAMTGIGVGQPVIHGAGSGAGVGLVNVIIDQNGVDNIGTTALELHDCEFRNTGSTSVGTNAALSVTGTVGATVCTFNGWRGPLVSVVGGGTASVDLDHCLLINGKADAVTLSASQTARSRIHFCTIDANVGAGIKVADTSGCTFLTVTNCQVTNNGTGLYSGAADAVTSARAMRIKWDSNNLYGNTTARTNLSAGPNDTAINPTYIASGSQNYGLGAGFTALPSSYRGSSTNTNLTVGAAGGIYTDPGITNVTSGTSYTFNGSVETGTYSGGGGSTIFCGGDTG